MKPAGPSTHKAEEGLIRKASQGSLEAFNQLVLRHQDLAYQHAYALLGDAASAEDVTQESFIKAFQNVRSFRGRSFRAWLLRIVTSTAYDLRRETEQHPIQSQFPEDVAGEGIENPARLVDPSSLAEATMGQNEGSKRISQLLDELPDVHRSVLTLVDIHGLDYGEAAEILNLPVSTVKSRLARARQEMKNTLQADSGYSFHIDHSTSLIPS